MATLDTDKTCLELFAGAGGLAIGTGRAGFRHVAAVERDPHACETLRANAPFPVLEADATGLDYAAWRGVDLVCGGPPCFATGTLILTLEGYRPIESIEVGDMVLTHKGRWRKVTTVMRRRNICLRNIKAQGVPGLRTTNEHPFLARLRTRHWREGRVFSDPDWMDARHIGADHFLSQILPKVERDDHDSHFWWLVGRYLADGCLSERYNRPNGRVYICCSAQEADALESDIRKAGFNPYRSRKRTVVNFEINNVALYKFLLQFGRYAHGKLLPKCALALNPSKSKSLLDGYRSGDGCLEHPPRSSAHWRIGSTSKALALSMALIAQRAYGVVASVGAYKPAPKKIIEGRTVNQRTRWVLNIPKMNRSAFIEGDFGWKKVRKNEPDGKGDVHNIAVAEDESYVAEGAVVHNCQPFSAGGRAEGSGDARDMFPTLIRAVRETGSRLVLVENVKGLLRPRFGWYLRYILMQLSRPSVAVGAGESPESHMSRMDASPAEYQVSHFLLNAADFGVPQVRERVFLLASKSGEPAAPRPSRSLRALLRDQWQTGENANRGAYWERHGIGRPGAPPARLARKVDSALGAGVDGLMPWLTVRDAISDIMGDAPPRPAKSYKGHTGSDLDMPSKTLKAGVHGVPGGENMVRTPEGDRHYTAREAARVQGFPDSWGFNHSWTRAMRQIGNAVPPPLAECVARALAGGA